ncbi:hypothetical protein HPP92_014968 [Vanilla planifolia]|uniref:Uncharacterized protein n=1 Tax=Vanilla planifolia TaxID=51239 RepID=A0A835UVC8_VANPL|nr:hypothetical protein HPP92_014968 [Vanilla planifolia]
MDHGDGLRRVRFVTAHHPRRPGLVLGVCFDGEAVRVLHCPRVGLTRSTDAITPGIQRALGVTVFAMRYQRAFVDAWR